MATVLNKTTKQFIASVNTPDYPTSDWIINPNMSPVSGIQQRYWFIEPDDTVREMTAAEKDSNHLISVQSEKMSSIDIRTTELILEGFEYPASSGQIFSLSPELQDTLEGIHQAKDDPAINYPIEWNFKDNTGKLSLADAAAIDSFYLMALGEIRAHRDSGTSLKDSVRAATTVAGVDAVTDNR